MKKNIPPINTSEGHASTIAQLKDPSHCKAKLLDFYHKFFSHNDEIVFVDKVKLNASVTASIIEAIKEVNASLKFQDREEVRMESHSNNFSKEDKIRIRKKMRLQEVYSLLEKMGDEENLEDEIRRKVRNYYRGAASIQSRNRNLTNPIGLRGEGEPEKPKLHFH